MDYHYNAVLILSDNLFFLGFFVGVSGKVIGEACFTTSMTGYQESVTDPSYNSQILVFTFPHIGNTGFNSDDCEKQYGVGLHGLVLREHISLDTGYRSNGNFNTWLSDRGVVGICGIDTRAVTRYLVKNGHDNCMIAPYDGTINISDLQHELKESKMLSYENLAYSESCSKPFDWTEGLWGVKNDFRKNLKVAVVDFGVKSNILRHLYSLGCDVRVFPYTYSVEQIFEYDPDGLLLSNGPGDPLKIFEEFKDNMNIFLSKNIPLFGICFGHQLLALALGCSVYKMTHCHRSITHPVLKIDTNSLHITTQNHGFAVKNNSLNNNAIVTHYSLLDNCVEGLRSTKYNAFSVQYHPECSPGANDSVELFSDFINMMKTNKFY